MENDTFVSFISSFLLEPPPERDHPGGSKVVDHLSPPHLHHPHHHHHLPHHTEEEEEEEELEEDTAIGVDNFVEVPFSHDVHLVALRDRAFSWDVSLENDKFLPDQLLGGLVTHDHNHHTAATSSSSSKSTPFYRPKVFTGKEDHQTVHSHHLNNHVINESYLKLEHDHDHLVHDMVVHDDDEHFLLDGEGELFADDDLLPSDYPLSSYEGGAGGSNGGVDMPVNHTGSGGNNTRSRPRIRLSLKAESQSPAPTTNSSEQRNRTGGNSRKRTYSDQNKGSNTKKDGNNTTANSAGGNNNSAGGNNGGGSKNSNNRNRGSGGGANNNSNNSLMEGSNGSTMIESGSPSKLGLLHSQSSGQLSLSQPQQQQVLQQQQQVQPPALLPPNQVSLQQMAGLPSGAGGSNTTYTYPDLSFQSSGGAMTAGSSSSMSALGSNSSLLLPGTMGSMQSSIISLTGTMGGVDRRVGAYTIEERRLKIEKFRERKRQRIWRKQIKYDCRKRLADTRPRVKGRFVSRKKLNAEGGGGGEDGNNDGSGDEDDEGNGGNRDNNNEDEEGSAKDPLAQSGHTLSLNRETSVGMESVASSTNYASGATLSTSYSLLNSTSQASSSGALPGTGINRPPHTLATIPSAPSSSMMANTVSGSMVGAGGSGNGGFASIVSGPSILATALTTGLVPSMSATVAPGITTTTLTLPALTVPSSVNVGMGMGVGSSLNVATASSSSIGMVGSVGNGQLSSVSGATVSSSPLYSNGTLAGQQSFNGAMPPNLMNTALYTSTADHNNVLPQISASSSLSLTSSSATTSTTTTVMK